ncbi:S-layer homology domain-containing protein [Thermus thermophilus]|uniref:S-layer protein n=1 Tax=Thermus thermophilus TaxID=274 RepID=A0AAD1KVZ3_THETH|nr:S-layer homology domain-containing protein [Thermus thermophilus]BBL83183.1 S-layer protein [Thermus thermophilus]BBL85482.1 S-layer protein [Thermus thermophilus]BCZ87829.1 S-layer protein [Thermus thermophilus]BCZ90191.1 S-layer protein [Thermus thermophilus]BCZ95405.1 S-layer protein [Thermus thermophilus]
MKKRLVTLLAGLLTVLSMGFGLAQFSDVPAGHWAKEAVEALAAKGIILGFPDGTFRGNENLTRYQAALLIYRLLQQIEEELKTQGTSPTMEALAPEDLEALKNAVQELAAELASLGVRVSALEDSAATKEDIARLEAMIAELKAQPMPEPGMDQAALQDLMDRVEAASIAADTALAQAQQLAERLDALAQDVEGVKGDLAGLRSQVEANADAIQALNELAVLLNQDVLSLQDRVTALEKLVSGGQELPDLEQFATKEDVAAVQEFAAALRSDLVGLSEKVSKLEEQVAELNKVRYSISGSLSATYGTVVTDTGTNFDIDRLFPGNAFSTGTYGSFSSSIQAGDSNQGNISLGSASLTFGVKVAQPGTSGVNVSEASATLQVPAAFGTTYTSAPTIRLNAASVKGNVDGQAFSVVYSRAVSSFKFNDYLFANDNDSEAANPRQGMVATFSATKFPLAPEVTVVAGVAGAGGDGTPALNGNYFGIRTALKPFSALNLALNYATNLGNRSAIGVDGGLELGPAKLSGLWVSSQTPGSPFADFFDNTLSDWAYYAQAETKLGPLSLSANYHAVDPQYADGQAGMSENEDTNYYGGLKAGAPYGANTRGLGVSASVGFGPVTLKGYAESEGDYNKSAGSVNDALGVAVTLGKFRGFSLTGFYNAAYDSGNDYFAFANPVDALGSYYYTIENQKYSSSWGVRVAHDGQAEDALISTLNLTAQYATYYVSGHTDIQVYADLAKPFKLAILSLSPGFRYHSFAGAGGAPTYTTLKGGVQVSTDPLLFGLSLDGAVSYRQTQYTNNPSGVTTYELYYRAGVKFQDFLAPKLNFSVAYAHYEGDQLSGTGLPVVGSGNQAFNFTRDRVYRSPDPIGGPWAATPGTQAGKLDGFYIEAKYYDLTVAYGEFVLNDLAGTSPNFGRGFKISYTVKF